MAVFVPEKASQFYIALAEPVAYLGNSHGCSIVRGEVIVNFPKDTPIQGPIDLVFKGTQIVHPWFELMDRPATGKFVDTTLHLVKLSLSPPNKQSIMPKGIQRFPFEFPIPGSLPISIFIPCRLNILYKVIATLCKSFEEERRSWMDWTRLSKRSELKSTAYLRLVRAIETVPALIHPPDVQSHRIPAHELDEAIAVEDATLHSRETMESFSGLSNATNQDADDTLSDSSESLFTLALDEQYDHLASSMAGRSVDNYSQHHADFDHGVLYKIAIDRTAIVLGTSLGVQVQVRSTKNNIKIRSIVVRISETRAFSIKIPHNYYTSCGTAQIRKASDTVSMVLKWGYGNTDQDDLCNRTSSSVKTVTRLSHKYRHRCPHPLCPDVPITNTRCKRLPPGQRPLSWAEDYQGESNPFDEDTDPPIANKLVNLKELDEVVQVGEYFDGSFEMLVPKCKSMLRPSMISDSLSISHWASLEVIIESNNKPYKLTLRTPIRLLDCRLIAHNDERQTILPPPPSYEEVKMHSNTYNSANIWNQRWPITQDALLGVSEKCPCELRLPPKDKSTSETTSPPMCPLLSHSQSKQDAPPNYFQ